MREKFPAIIDLANPAMIKASREGAKKMYLFAPLRKLFGSMLLQQSSISLPNSLLQPGAPYRKSLNNSAQPDV